MCIGTVYFLRQLPSAYYIGLVSVIAIIFLLWILFKLIFKPEKYIDSRGYVVLAKFQELEHRHIAKQLLKRDLTQNEIVHHVNGKKTDNQIENLCLMDREKHEHFHAWLMWKNKKSGRYPTIQDQKRILESDYEGRLLENVMHSKLDGDATQETDRENIELVLQKRLFNELRKIRKQIADEKNIPVYMVFDNRTLTEMSEEMPDSESHMLQIWGVGSVKMQMYGSQFLTAIEKFKYENN